MTRSRRFIRLGVAISAAGALVLLAGIAWAPQAVAVSYLAVYTATTAIAVGALLLIMFADLSGAVWFEPFRPHAEIIVSALPALAALAIPLVVVFGLRTIVYWAAWLVLAHLVPKRRVRVSAAGVPIAALALTYAAFDWTLSRTEWFSPLAGVYYFSGGIVGALALLAVMGAQRSLRGRESAPRTDHYQALGRLLLAFVLFWGYIWYSQFFIAWIGDIPREAQWYAVRLHGGWRAVAYVLLWIGFVVPVFVLLFRAARGSALVMAGTGIWLLAGRYLDIYWMLVPAVRPHWTLASAVWDVAALLTVAGSAAALAIWRSERAPATRVTDALLTASLEYEAH